MKQEQMDKFLKQLEDMRDNILREAGKMLSEMNDKSETYPDPNDRATAESERNFKLKIRNRERKLLEKVEESIERISAGDYGVCEQCEEDIALKRLEARPVTTLCIDCKAKQEQIEKAHGK